MRTIGALALATLLPVAAIASVAATPESATDCRDFDGTSEICRTQVFLVCDNEAPLLNVPQNDGNAGWSYDAPTGSFQEGAGCGEFDETIFGETSQGGALYSFDMVGNVEGNLDQMTVELHNLDLGQGRAGDVTIQARITIDGKSPFGTEQLLDVTGEPHANPARVSFAVSPVEANDGATMVYRFTVTGLNAALGTVNAERPDKSRLVMITLDVSTDDGPEEGRAPDYVGFNPWVWGATEVPSGVTFNGLDDEDKGTILESVVEG